MKVITIRPSRKYRPSLVGIGTGTVIPSRSRCRNSSVSQPRSASLRPPSRATPSCPLTRKLQTSLTPPPVSRSTRATSLLHWLSASHPTHTIFAEPRDYARAELESRVQPALGGVRLV